MIATDHQAVLSDRANKTYQFRVTRWADILLPVLLASLANNEKRINSK